MRQRACAPRPPLVRRGVFRTPTHAVHGHRRHWPRRPVVRRLGPIQHADARDVLLLASGDAPPTTGPRSQYYGGPGAASGSALDPAAVASQWTNSINRKCGAPSRIRTDTGRCLRPLPLPLGYRGHITSPWVMPGEVSGDDPRPPTARGIAPLTPGRGLLSWQCSLSHSPDRARSVPVWGVPGPTTTVGTS
jgi:hypothetical protein